MYLKLKSIAKSVLATWKLSVQVTCTCVVLRKLTAGLGGVPGNPIAVLEGGGGEHTNSQTLTKRDIANENRYNK